MHLSPQHVLPTEGQDGGLCPVNLRLSQSSCEAVCSHDSLISWTDRLVEVAGDVLYMR